MGSSKYALDLSTLVLVRGRILAFCSLFAYGMRTLFSHTSCKTTFIKIDLNALAMVDLTFESSTELREVAPDVYENVHPAWTWYETGVVPGGLVMALSVAAGWKTIPDGYTLDNLHSQFLSGSKPNIPYQYSVQRISNGKRFIVRTVLVEQEKRPINLVTLCFINSSPWKGASLRYSVNQEASQRVEQISIDDLEPGRSSVGPFMKFQRLPLIHLKPKESSIQPVVAQIIGPISTPPGSKGHVLGLINLSDYHVLDAPINLRGYSTGQPSIGDASGNPTRSDIKLLTSLNHTVHFHTHRDFRADELTYIEVTSPWANDGRGMAHSRIFSKDGTLIATCVQETYHIFKADSAIANQVIHHEHFEGSPNAKCLSSSSVASSLALCDLEMRSFEGGEVVCVLETLGNTVRK